MRVGILHDMSEREVERAREAARRVLTASVSMDYPGGQISKNRLWRGGDRRRGLNPVAARWKRDLAESVRGWLLCCGVRRVVPPVHIVISGAFVDKAHAPDLHNLAELVCDAVEAGTGVNDRDITVSTEPATYGVVVPFIGIALTVTLGGAPGGEEG